MGLRRRASSIMAFAAFWKSFCCISSIIRNKNGVLQSNVRSIILTSLASKTAVFLVFCPMLKPSVADLRTLVERRWHGTVARVGAAPLPGVPTGDAALDAALGSNG